jgi:hypothetical protein
MDSWTWGTATIGPKEIQRWWLWWANYPGFEVIGAQAMTPGDELRFEKPGFQLNVDGSTTHYITVSNPTTDIVLFHFRGKRL